MPIRCLQCVRPGERHRDGGRRSDGDGTVCSAEGSSAPYASKSDALRGPRFYHRSTRYELAGRERRRAARLLSECPQLFTRHTPDLLLPFATPAWWLDIECVPVSY